LQTKDLKQPAYNPDQTPSKYIPSPAFNQNLSGHKFKNDQETKCATCLTTLYKDRYQQEKKMRRSTL